MGSPERFTYFWGHRPGSALPECSQMFPSPFVLEGQAFSCAEQWMHWKKSQLFGDAAVAGAILAEADPMRHKALGRQVAAFSAPAWGAVARCVVFRGNVAKFGQNPPLLERLRATAGTTLVEAAPNDAIWGIGLRAGDARARDRATWQGTNWLGEVLTEVRIALCGL